MIERTTAYKLFASALLFGALVSDAAAQTDSPIAIRDQHPLALLHLSTVPQSAFVIGAGQTDLSSTLAVSNTINRERGDFLIDAETRVLELGARHAITPSLELSLHGSLVYRGGGETDQSIQEWHSIFGLPNGQRKRVPQNSFALEGTNRDGSTFSFERDGTALGDLVVGAKQQLWESASRDSVGSIALRTALPTGADSYGQDAVDIAADLLGGFRLTPQFTLHGGVGYIIFGDSEEEGLHYRRHHGNGFLTAAYRITPVLSILIQAVGATALLQDLPRYPDFSSYLDVAIRYSRQDLGTATLLLRENPSPDKSTTDVTLLAELHVPIFSR